MRGRSIAGPVILIALGGLLLLSNLRPDFSIWTNFVRYWPFLLITFGVLRLAEVLVEASRGTLNVPPPPGAPYAGRRRNGSAGLIIFLCLIFWAAAHNHNRTLHFGPFTDNWNDNRVQLFGEQYDYPISGKGDAAGVTLVVLEGLRGNVTVTGGDGDDYTAEGRKSVRAYSKTEADEADRKSELKFVRDGNQLLIKIDDSHVSSDRNVSTEIDLKVPRGVNVEAHGRSGDVTVSSITGTLDISSDKGDVRLNEIGGNAKLSIARSGLVRITDSKGGIDLDGKGTDIQLENVGGAVTVNGSYSGTMEFRKLAKSLRFQSPNTDMRVESIPGSLTLDLGDLRANDIAGPMRFHTKSRDVHLEDFAGELDLDLSDRGDIEVSTNKTPLAKLDLHTKNGNIDLSLPEKASFDLRATTNQGEAHNDFGPAVRMEVSGRSATLTSANDSGPAIVATADRGSISVRKSSPGKD